MLVLYQFVLVMKELRSAIASSLERNISFKCLSPWEETMWLCRSQVDDEIWIQGRLHSEVEGVIAKWIAWRKTRIKMKMDMKLEKVGYRLGSDYSN